MTDSSPTRTQTTSGAPPSRLSAGERSLAFARSLATEHAQVGTITGKASLLELLDPLSNVLQAAHQAFAHPANEDVALSYAAEWILDNYYVVQQALREVREDLPEGYLRKLPLLVEGPWASYPRVYAVARRLLEDSQARLDLNELPQFLDAYQSQTPLTMGETWAVPTMLRLGTLEILAQALGHVVVLDLPRMKAIPEEFWKQSDPDTTVGTCIVTLRALSVQDWAELFERVSLVHRILAKDPAQLYLRMDFQTRDRYRKVLEVLALRASVSEQAAAEGAVALANEGITEDGEIRGPQAEAPRTSHVGYYLIGDGQPLLEERLGYRPSGVVALQRWIMEHASLVYLGAIGLFTALPLAAFANYVARAGGGAGQVIVACLLAFVPLIILVTALVNLGASLMLRPRVFPKLDFEEGIPEECRTAVVVPAMLTSADEVTSLLQQLELHYLRNEDPSLVFGLLTDLADAPSKDMPGDQALLAQAQEGIDGLNKRYSIGGHAPFFALHRDRKWNDQEGVWMGWERKRGKLEELNRLITGLDGSGFAVKLGAVDALAHVRYVITLDADTVLPRGAAQRLVGALAHPLNRARFAKDGKVVAGYTVLQPRTEVLTAGTQETLFTEVYAGDSGLDLYTRAVSDVYQDLFGEGIYVGKGIYDVQAFQRSLAGRAPENSLLSHDLFEGIHGRAGLVTDIILYEKYPPAYLAYARRVRRWIRGDWQLLPWLMPRVPMQDGTRAPNTLRAIDRWKVLSNLSRSLLSPAVLAVLVASWLGLPGSVGWWTLLGLLGLGVPLLTSAILAVRQGITSRALSAAVYPLKREALRWLFALFFLPYESLIALSAIATTLVRLLITRKHLLQWTTAAHAARLLGQGRQITLAWRRMYIAPLAAVVVAALVAVFNLPALPLAAPILLLWLISPYVAYLISQPAAHIESPVTEEDRGMLASLARRTWLFFEQFVGPEDNWLPPDHFQESPRGLVAHRTSPTNIGLMLLCDLAAYDLGYIGALDLILRLRPSLDTLDKLEKHRGHWLNWYDTRSLAPLSPRYVSTVDSGNLAACLMALRQGLEELSGKPVLRWERWRGLFDAFHVLDEQVHAMAETQPMLEALHAKMHEIQANANEKRERVELWPQLLKSLAEEQLPELEQGILELISVGSDAMSASALHSLHVWSGRTSAQAASMLREIQMLMPWLESVEGRPDLPSGCPNAECLEKWRALEARIVYQPRLDELPQLAREIESLLGDLQQALEAIEEPGPTIAQAIQWCSDCSFAIDQAPVVATATSILVGAGELDRRIQGYISEMSFGFLLDPRRKVFHIGYNVDAENTDANYYDLLASEARIASLVAIGKGDVPQEHWLYMSRPLTLVDGKRVILSWNGSMFEYLMPLLLIRNYQETLLGQSVLGAVEEQISYGRRRRVPWGISESGYYYFDADLNYQYRGFGVPGLGLKRGLGEDLVITPYASLLALPLRPQEVVQNAQRLIEMGVLRDYGFYEAVDYTDVRLPLGQDRAVVQSYMAHHQGMILLSLANYIIPDLMVDRFHRDSRIQSAELLIQEQVPRFAPIEGLGERQEVALRPPQQEPRVVPWTVPVSSAYPLAHYLSNGDYGVLLTNAGAGYSHWHDKGLTRWRADTTRNDWGTWIYVQDRKDGSVWTLGRQPIAGEGTNREVHFYPHKVALHTFVRDLAFQMEVAVAPDHDAEIRRIRITNQSGETRSLRIASYGEMVLAEQSADRRHPAFNKLFIQSEYVRENAMLLFHRRLRSSSEEPLYVGHLLAMKEKGSPEPVYETDRALFLGRGRSAANPAAFDPDGKGWTRTTGTVLDPIMSLAQDVELPPHATRQLAFITLASDSRSGAVSIARSYSDWASLEHAFDLAQSSSEMEMRRLELTSQELASFQHLYSLLTYPHPALRASAEELAKNIVGQSRLWPHAISGDYPILLVRVRQEEEITLAYEALKAHIYWRSRGIKVDLVFLDDQEGVYQQPVQLRLRRLVNRMKSDEWLNQRGGIFMLRRADLDDEDATLLLTAARVILDTAKGSLAQQIELVQSGGSALPELAPTRVDKEREPTPALERPADLLFDNGLGGFTPDGSEYVIYLQPGQLTPLPWVNVVANPTFGFLASESGLGCTWALNSGENRLTPWRNDPVSDPPGEALYLRDEETVEAWTPTPLPKGASEPYLIRHGAGYSSYEHHSHGLKQRVRVFTPPDSPVKVVQLSLENTWTRQRRITATYYVEWVLGVDRDSAQTYVVPEYDADLHAILARNPYSADFQGRVAFLAASQVPHGVTADRAEFLGRLGDPRIPAALLRVGLSGVVTPGRDPCGAIQLHLDMEPGQSKEVYFLLGQGNDRDAALTLVRRYQDREQVQDAWAKAVQSWDDLVGAIQVETPDSAMNIMLNRWLLHQDISCRFWGRSAFYQPSGAFGFRDQLQDVLALLHTAPQLAREHILESARHQFQEGDVLHWWHPPSGVGVRTRISDDLLWLPYVAAEYAEVTGDASIWDEEVPFLTGKPLTLDEEERYALYSSTQESHSLYEHCVQAIHRGLTKGSHGLPLMRAGDWNDGMNRVGARGKGESVWLGWFTCAVLDRFAPVAKARGDAQVASELEQRASELREALAAQGWDGDWYLRAFYDSGQPLGSSKNEECQIDSIAQSWAVLSKAGGPEQTSRAMDAVCQRLVRPEDKLILLFAPPFDRTPLDPGYIKGYPPGVRENGGQYTHAAVWTAWAMAELGRNDDAEELFRMLNPIYRSADAEGVARYKVEPYVMAGDVYSVAPYVGRGGWTWYTGSAGWMYRLGVEAILGVKRRGDTLGLAPRLPSHWPGFDLTYRYRSSVYQIHVSKDESAQAGKVSVSVDGQAATDSAIALADDGQQHAVEVKVGGGIGKTGA